MTRSTTDTFLLDRIYTKLMLGGKATQTQGDGEERARRRLAAKRKANEKIPSAYRETRQQRRRGG